MKIGRKCNWHRPYHVDVNDRDYEVSNIHLYNEDGVIVSTQFGWFEKHGYNSDIESIELPIDEIKLKRKQKFDGTVFVMTCKDFLNKTVAELYIPANMLDIHFVGYEIKHGYQIRAIYSGMYGINIESYVKSIDEELNNIRAEYEEVYKRVDEFDLSYANTDKEKFLSDIDLLKDLAVKYHAEKDRLDSLTIDDIEL